MNGPESSGDGTKPIKHKNMKKIAYALILSLVFVGGLVFANRAIKKEIPAKVNPRPLTAAEMNAERKKWEATPAGMAFKKWEASPEGKKVLDGMARIRKELREFSEMEATVTSLTLPPGSRLGFGVMARINDVDYILSFGVESAKEFQPLQGLKVNDKIIIRSRNVSYAPKYAYPIISGDYVEKDKQVLYKRPPRKGGC